MKDFASFRCYNCDRAASLMSEEQLKAFIAKAKDDQSIQEKLKAAKTPDDVIGIAEEHGHEFTQEHMNQLNQLSEEELEGVAGGGWGQTNSNIGFCVQCPNSNGFCE